MRRTICARTCSKTCGLLTNYEMDSQSRLCLLLDRHRAASGFCEFRHHVGGGDVEPVGYITHELIPGCGPPDAAENRAKRLKSAVAPVRIVAFPSDRRASL